MSLQKPLDLQARSPVRRTSRSWLRTAVVVYVCSWAVGLVVGAPAVVRGEPGSTVLAAYQASSSSLLQAVLVHGLAGILLVVIAFLASTRLSRPWPARVAGLLAGFFSFVQLGIEVALAAGFASAGSAAMLWELVMRVDGVKMCALAALVLTLGPVVGGRQAVVGRVLVVVTAAALLVSGAGYLLLHGGLMGVAFVSLPLLLVWSLAVAWGTETRRA